MSMSYKADFTSHAHDMIRIIIKLLSYLEQILDIIYTKTSRNHFIWDKSSCHLSKIQNLVLRHWQKVTHIKLKFICTCPCTIKQIIIFDDQKTFSNKGQLPETYYFIAIINMSIHVLNYNQTLPIVTDTLIIKKQLWTIVHRWAC